MSKPILTSLQLGQPAPLVARSVARAFLLQLLEAAARLEIQAGEPKPTARNALDPAQDDPEAVHDFRVALRRLRSWLQAFRPLLKDSVDKRSRQRLRRLSRLAGDARDRQVERVTLAELDGKLRPALLEEAKRIEARLIRREFRARRALRPLEAIGSE